ncbi:MerR family transcriptional regulator [Fournierella massiliensis]|uniref:MerR family transcriptional regulator n=1 Tax=Allofournierella massiliensis TaxID=1650663 RepID=UPI003522C58C
MRIAQVSECTGIHRKTIHHYIQLGLVCPATEQENGYYDFSQEDLRRLQTIQRLRLLDCPLSLIRELLDHPRLSRFLLDRMIQQKKRQIETGQWQIQQLEQLVRQAPLDNMEQSDRLWAELPEHLPPPRQSLTRQEASFLVSYFWGTFLQGLEMNEYRRYLWERLVDRLLEMHQPPLLALRGFLETVPPQKLEIMFVENDRHVRRIVELDSASIPAQVEQMARQLEEKLEDPAFVRDWRENYEHFVQPAAELYSDLEALRLMGQFTGRFERYGNNLWQCSYQMYAHLNTPQGQPLREKIHRALGDRIRLEGQEVGQLATLLVY